MTALIFIGLVGVFTYHCQSNYQNFRGSSASVEGTLGCLGYLGYPVYIILLIWSFWHFTWWQPILTAVLTFLLGGLTAPLFQETLWGKMASLVLLVISIVLSVVFLIC